jgi:hypothetical protein
MVSFSFSITWIRYDIKVYPYFPFMSKLDCIGDQVGEDLPDPENISNDLKSKQVVFNKKLEKLNNYCTSIIEFKMMSLAHCCNPLLTQTDFAFRQS